jgi:hypothetical protein
MLIGVWTLVLGAVVVLIWVAINWFQTRIDPVSDPGKYAAVVKNLKQEGVISVAHFPDRIAASATVEKFLYQPAFLQSGFELRLEYWTSKDEVAKLVQSIKPKAITSPSGKVYPSIHSLPSRFQPHILGLREQSDGNHGQSYGVAIDSTHYEIAYWAEEW